MVPYADDPSVLVSWLEFHKYNLGFEASLFYYSMFSPFCLQSLLGANYVGRKDVVRHRHGENSETGSLPHLDRVLLHPLRGNIHGFIDISWFFALSPHLVVPSPPLSQGTRMFLEAEEQVGEDHQDHGGPDSKPPIWSRSESSQCSHDYGN